MQGGLLLSSQSFENYELYFDVWPDYNIDTGVYLRTNSSYAGIQATIDYTPGKPVGGVWINTGFGDWSFTTKNQNEIQGSPSYFPVNEWQKIWKAGTWNKFKIRIQGNKIEIWINGYKVHEYVDYSNRFSGSGKIGLQVHDGPDDWISSGKVRFKNIMVYPL